MSRFIDLLWEWRWGLAGLAFSAECWALSWVLWAWVR